MSWLWLSVVSWSNIIDIQFNASRAESKRALANLELDAAIGRPLEVDRLQRLLNSHVCCAIH
jgi:hypothetical protein